MGRWRVGTSFRVAPGMRVWVSRGFGSGRRRPAAPRSGPGCLVYAVGAVLALVALGVAWFALAFAAIVLVPLSVFLAARVLRNAQTASTISGSRFWGRLPGMRSATGAGAVASLLVLYGTLIPGACLTSLVVVANTSTPQSPPAAGPVIPTPTALPTDSPTPTVTPTPTPTPVPTDTPTPLPPTPTAAPVHTAPPPTPRPTPRPTAPPPPPTQAASLCGAPANPYGYNFCGGSPLFNPAPDICSYIDCIPSFWTSTKGYVDQCKDGTFSHSGGRQGACSYHDGELRPLDG